jgi:integrase
MHRLCQGVTETKKRRPPCRIPAALIPHLEQAREAAIGSHVIMYGGQPLQSFKKSFTATVRRAGLSADVIPHVLRHTCATWLAQAGGLDVQGGRAYRVQRRRIRAHLRAHCPDFQHAAAAISAVFPAEAGARPLACGAKWQLSYCK